MDMLTLGSILSTVVTALLVTACAHVWSKNDSRAGRSTVEPEVGTKPGPPESVSR